VTDTLLRRIPVVAGRAYIERLSRLPPSFTAALQPERENRYLPQALAVIANGEKVGYVAPEVARRYYEPISAHPTVLTCPARRASLSDRETSGVELLLDFSDLPVEPRP
jgi:hypothetical protein